MGVDKNFRKAIRKIMESPRGQEFRKAYRDAQTEEYP